MAGVNVASIDDFEGKYCSFVVAWFTSKQLHSFALH